MNIVWLPDLCDKFNRICCASSSYSPSSPIFHFRTVTQIISISFDIDLPDSLATGSAFARYKGPSEVQLERELPLAACNSCRWIPCVSPRVSLSLSHSHSHSHSRSVCVLCVICKTDVSHMSCYAICGHMSLLTSNSGPRATSLPSVFIAVWELSFFSLSRSLKIAAIVWHLILRDLPSMKFIHSIYRYICINATGLTIRCG